MHVSYKHLDKRCYPIPAKLGSSHQNNVDAWAILRATEKKSNFLLENKKINICPCFMFWPITRSHITTFQGSCPTVWTTQVASTTPRGPKLESVSELTWVQLWRWPLNGLGHSRVRGSRPQNCKWAVWVKRIYSRLRGCLLCYTHTDTHTYTGHTHWV